MKGKGACLGWEIRLPNTPQARIARTYRFMLHVRILETFAAALPVQHIFRVKKDRGLVMVKTNYFRVSCD